MVIVKHEHMECVDLTEDEEFKYAEENSRKDLQLSDMGIRMGLPFPFPKISTHDGTYGAVGLYITDAMKELCRMHEVNEITVIPSSVHEILVVPVEMPIDELKNLIGHVNDTEVEPQERLSYNAYIYNATEDKVRIA